jgi:hypothetical protein
MRISAKCRRKASTLATAAGPARNGRTRISETETADSAPAFRPVAMKASKTVAAASDVGSLPAR